MARAPWYVAAGRWLKGIGAKTRTDPRTGVQQIRQMGGGWWSPEYGTRKVQFQDTHPKPPKRAAGVQRGTHSMPIGISHAIGVGQRIGTTVGTAAYTSEMSSGDSFMPIGIGSIRGEPTKAARGGAGGGSSSGS